MAIAFQKNAFQNNAFQVADVVQPGFTEITDTQAIQLPVNCVLAGQQTSFRRGRIMGRGMRHTFNE